MATAILNASRLRELLHYDQETGVFTRKERTSNRIEIGSIAGTLRPDGYRKISLLHTSFLAHRLAWLYVHGEWPKEQIDHINGRRADNWIANLRDIAGGKNVENQHVAHKRNKSSGMLGVTWDARKKKWVAQICVKRQQTHIGYYATPQEASDAYIAKKRSLHEGCTI